MAFTACLRAALILVTLGAAYGCGGDAGDDDETAADSGDAPGETCTIDSICRDTASLCFGVGSGGSCRSNGLCAGGPGDLRCAVACAEDADCAEQGAATTCLLGCEEPLFNRFCVSPETAADLLGFEFCTEPSQPRRGIAGSSSHSP